MAKQKTKKRTKKKKKKQDSDEDSDTDDQDPEGKYARRRAHHTTPHTHCFTSTKLMNTIHVHVGMSEQSDHDEKQDNGNSSVHTKCQSINTTNNKLTNLDAQKCNVHIQVRTMRQIWRIRRKRRRMQNRRYKTQMKTMVIVVYILTTIK